MNEFLAFFGTFLCFLQNMSYFQSRKSSWRETTQGQLSFSKHWKWNVLLSFCRIAINKKCHSFKLLDYLSLCPIGFHEQDWLLAMTLQKRHFCQNWHRLFNACWGTSALVSFMCVSLHGQNLLCWTLGYIMSTMISCWLSLFVKEEKKFQFFNFPRALVAPPLVVNGNFLHNS